MSALLPQNVTVDPPDTAIAVAVAVAAAAAVVGGTASSSSTTVRLTACVTIIGQQLFLQERGDCQLLRLRIVVLIVILLLV